MTDVNAIVAEFANDFSSQLKDDLGRRDLAFLRALAETAEGTDLSNDATHVFHAARKGIVAAQGTERESWSWAFKGVQLVCPHSGETLQTWPKGEDQRWCRPADLLAALKAHQRGVLVWAD